MFVFVYLFVLINIYSILLQFTYQYINGLNVEANFTQYSQPCPIFVNCHEMEPDFEGLLQKGPLGVYSKASFSLLEMLSNNFNSFILQYQVGVLDLHKIRSN